MKNIFQLWNRVAGRTYSAVNTGVQEPNNIDPKYDPNKNKRRRNRRFTTLIILSFVSLAVGLFILLLHPYDYIFKLKNVFSDGGEIFEMWRKPEVNLYLQVYLFNVTNAEQFMSGKDKKMKFVQVGPYIYREQLEHGNVTFNSNGTLSTVPLHPLEWQAELSHPRKEDDIVIMPNIAYLSIGHVSSKKSFFVKMALNGLLGSTGAKPLVPMTAKEFMFGYTSSLVTLGNSFMPGWIKFDKLGLIDRMYDFENDFETVYTGEGEDGAETRAGLMDTWRGSRLLPQWGNTSCARIHMASDGSKYPGKLSQDSEVLFYRKSLCRAAPMKKIDEGYKNGLLAYKYTFKENILDNGFKNPENKCFCREGNCLPEGLVDVTDCYYGFPIALSYPHFLDSDEKLLEAVEGLNPVEELHRSDIWIQPHSGLPLGVNIKFQINLHLGNLDTIHGGKYFSKLTVPLLWFEFRMYGLPSSMANLFNLYLKILPEGEKVLMWLGLLGFAPFLAAAFLIKLRRPTDHIPKRTPVIWNDNSSYAKSLRKMSLDIEKSKTQSVYIPCELPLAEDQRESDTPFLNSDKASSESETETDVNDLSERRSSLIKTQADKIKDMGFNFGNRIQENIGEIGKNIKNFTNRFSSNEALKNTSTTASFSIQVDTSQSSEEDNYHPENRRYSMPGDILGKGNYHMVSSSDDDECCDLEIVDDGNEFNPTAEELFRRQSTASNKIERLNKLENADSSSANKSTKFSY